MVCVLKYVYVFGICLSKIEILEDCVKQGQVDLFISSKPYQNL